MTLAAVHVELVTAGWVTHGSASARGQAHVDGRFHSADDLARLFAGLDDDRQWRSVLARCNGSFALVIRQPDAVHAVADRVRSIPLFYRGDGGQAHVSDVAVRALAGPQEIESNPRADMEFQLTGYVTGDETLVAGLHQIQAGEAVTWRMDNPGAPEAWQYHRFEHGDYFRADPPDLIARLGLVHEGVFRRLVDSVQGRQIVIPLSGGYDSRLIGVTLRDLGARDVVCYSYGLADNWESRISRELAQYLGFRWEFVPYSVERWRQWASTPEFTRYFQDAGNLSSVPHIQDWPAVRELTMGGQVAPDSVFVPGHSGDFLAGSHVPPHFLDGPMVRRRAFLETLLGAHYSLWDWPRGARPDLCDTFTRRIQRVIGYVGDVAAPRAADLFEQWDLKERQAKFICNSVRVYEHFGHEWRLPLFDHELMDFWSRVPAPLRVGRKLYFDYVRERQQIPVTTPNTDRGALQSAMVRGVTAAGLKPLAKRLRRAYRTWRWRDEYASSSLGWFSIVDEDFFRRTYDGTQHFHSYMTRAYRNWVLAGSDRETIIPGLGPR